MDEYHGEGFLDDFVQFIYKRVDGRLEAMLTEDNRTANHEDRTAELESKIEELESQIEYYSDHEDRICELEETIEAIDRSQLLKDLTGIVDRRVHELASRGRLRIYVASSDPNTAENAS
jgi:DNA-binding transcriptional regulator GbsR (MarR family)